ncbi:Crp/Fnr family transcriptional regulator [Candidatus Saccharibacteria bacterium]|nr:Crp/Fnr family transcriptional regulator [Candidatus Saccharibacteria bacterium]
MARGSSAYQARIEKLFINASVKNYPKNQLIYYAGDELAQIYLIKEGYVKAYTILNSGDMRTIFLLGPGDIFPIDFSTTMDWHNYKVKYFYQALTDVKLQYLPVDSFKNTVEASTENMSTYMAYMSASNAAIMKQLEVMKSKKAINKVLMLLPYLITKFGEQIRPNAYRLKIKLSHQEIADLSGVTRETTTTLVKQLEKRGILQQIKGRLIIYTKRRRKQARKKPY